jgi:hypothetical protein
MFVSGLAIHGVLVACSSSSSSSNSNGTPNAMASGGTGSGASGGSQVVVATTDTAAEVPLGALSLAGRASLPASATAVYLEVEIPSGGGACFGDWTITGAPGTPVHKLKEQSQGIAYDVWMPVDSTQTVTIDNAYPKTGCSPKANVTLLGWVN